MSAYQTSSRGNRSGGTHGRLTRKGGPRLRRTRVMTRMTAAVARTVLKSARWQRTHAQFLKVWRRRASDTLRAVTVSACAPRPSVAMSACCNVRARNFRKTRLISERSGSIGCGLNNLNEGKCLRAFFVRSNGGIFPISWRCRAALKEPAAPLSIHQAIRVILSVFNLF